MSEKQIDALFRKIVQNDAEKESKKLLEQRQENPGDAVSELSRARFAKMLDRELSDAPAEESKKSRKPWLSKTAKRILVAAAAFVLVTFGLMMTSEAIRGRVTQFVVKLFGGYAEVKMDNIEELPPSDKIIYRLSYVPEGYRLVSESHEIGQQLRYVRGEEELLKFDVYAATAVSQLSTDDAVKVEHLTMHGEEALLIVYDDGFAQIMWSNEQYLFHIEGTLSEEVLLKVANGVTTADRYPEAPPSEAPGTVTEQTFWQPDYIPDGFELIHLQSEPVQIFEYRRDDEALLITVGSDSTATQIDTDGAQKVESVTVRGHDGLLTVNDDKTALTWSEDGRIFCIEGSITEEEAFAIADSFYPEIRIIHE